MKAVRSHFRGGSETLLFEDAPSPRLQKGDALVKVHAAAITPTELTWNSTWTDNQGRDRRPIVPSFEVSGMVDKVPSDETDLKRGDPVYGLLDFWRDGAAAEFVAVRATSLAPKPASLDHIQSSAVPLSGLTAWQALFDHARLSKGDRVLIHGAAGGVGSFAVQLAHWRGAKVIATASERHAAFLKALGADTVLDYASVRFEDVVQGVDAVLDTVGGETLERSWGVVRRDGVIVTIADDAPEDKAAKYGVRAASILVQPNRDELIQIGKLLDAGTIRPIVQTVFPLSDAREAFARGLGGHNQGKIVLRVMN
jgi:NADPH:quinone reductase-like Zn-dependent oxidoreductase